MGWCCLDITRIEIRRSLRFLNSAQLITILNTGKGISLYYADQYLLDMQDSSSYTFAPVGKRYFINLNYRIKGGNDG